MKIVQKETIVQKVHLTQLHVQRKFLFYKLNCNHINYEFTNCILHRECIGVLSLFNYFLVYTIVAELSMNLLKDRIFQHALTAQLAITARLKVGRPYLISR